ncbi:unnamed protein product [Mucor hiemalis]
MLKEGIFALSLLSSIALAIVIPIAPYKIGENDPAQEFRHTGAAVNSKIYMFGGQFAVKAKPYMVDPNVDDPYQIMFHHHEANTTDLSYVYDTTSGDEWKFETKTPIPWERADTVVVDNDIYFYDINSPGQSSRSKMYSYNTLTKEWSRKPDLPFVWREKVASCYSDVYEKIYFTERIGYQKPLRTIFHSYDVKKDEWDERIIITKETLSIYQLACMPESFKVIGRLHETNAITGEIEQENDYSFNRSPPKRDLFSITFDGGKVVAHNANSSLIQDNHRNPIRSYFYKDYIYSYGFQKEKTHLARLNINTLEDEMIVAELPYNFSAPLIMPINHNAVFLFGGGNTYHRYYSTPEERKNVVIPTVKSWNHKLGICASNSK